VPNLTYAYLSPAAYSSQTMYQEEKAFVPHLFQSQYTLVELNGTLCMKDVFSDPQVLGQGPFLRGCSDTLRDTSTFNTINELLFSTSLCRFLKQRIVISPVDCIKYSLHFRNDSSQYSVGFFSISMSPESNYFILHHVYLVSAVMFRAFCDGSSDKPNCFMVNSRYSLSEVIIFP